MVVGVMGYVYSLPGEVQLFARHYATLSLPSVIPQCQHQHSLALPVIRRLSPPLASLVVTEKDINVLRNRTIGTRITENGVHMFLGWMPDQHTDWPRLVALCQYTLTG